jgi:hypothetical protein
MWVALVAVAWANPDRLLARTTDELKSARYAAIEGEIRPLARWRRIGAAFEASVFPDGQVEHFVRYDRRDPKEASWYNAGGDRIATATWEPGARPFRSVIPASPPVDVASWAVFPFGGLNLLLPTTPAPVPVGDTLVVGRTTFVTLPAGPVLDDAFGADLASTCACALLDRNTAWVAGITGVRYRFSRSDGASTELGEVWAVPVGEVVLAAFATWSEADPVPVAELRAALLFATLATS